MIFPSPSKETKETALDSMIDNSYAPVGDDSIYPMRIAQDGAGKNVVLIKEKNGTIFAGDAKGVTALPPASVSFDGEGNITSAAGYTLLDENQTSQVLDQFNE
ncbi:MAG: hypothetical protein EBX75_00765, partial [Actinobacteria bacterium]|nr:hypothetical protein [Actinomycetota bacterium]